MKVMALKERVWMFTGNNVLIRMQEEYAELSNSEKLVADYVRSNPDEIMMSTIASVAKTAGVSEPTVVRFCRKLDFSGYQDFKIALARGGMHSDETLKIIHEEVKETDSLDEISLKVMNSHILALQQTFAAIDYEKFQMFLDMVMGSGKIEFFGLGGSGTVAIDVENKFLRTGIATNVCIDTHIQLMRTALLSENDTIVIFSNSGTTKHFVNVLKVAKKNNVNTVIITSAKNTVLTRNATLSFQIFANETSYKKEPSTARMAMLAIMDAIVTAIALKKKDAYIKNIYKTRDVLDKEK